MQLRTTLGRKLLLSAAAMLAVSTLLVACGGDDDDDADPTSASGGNTPAASASPTAATADETPASAETPGADGDAVIAIGETDLGSVLVNADGLTLYTFDNDTEGVSNCNDGCAAAWPPANADEVPSVDGASGEFSLITRTDGVMQIAYNGAPLYTYAADTAPGDTTGDGVGGVWHIATP